MCRTKKRRLLRRPASCRKKTAAIHVRKILWIRFEFRPVADIPRPVSRRDPHIGSPGPVIPGLSALGTLYYVVFRGGCAAAISFPCLCQIVCHILSELFRFALLGFYVTLGENPAGAFVQRHHRHQFHHRLARVLPRVGLQALVDGVRGQADDLFLLGGGGGQVERPFCDLDADFLVHTLAFQIGDALVDLPYQLIHLLFGGGVVAAGGKGFSKF